MEEEKINTNHTEPKKILYQHECLKGLINVRWGMPKKINRIEFK